MVKQNHPFLFFTKVTPLFCYLSTLMTLSSQVMITKSLVTIDDQRCIYENMAKGSECGKYSKTDFKQK